MSSFMETESYAEKPWCRHWLVYLYLEFRMKPLYWSSASPFPWLFLHVTLLVTAEDSVIKDSVHPKNLMASRSAMFHSQSNNYLSTGPSILLLGSSYFHPSLKFASSPCSVYSVSPHVLCHVLYTLSCRSLPIFCPISNSQFRFFLLPHICSPSFSCLYEWKVLESLILVLLK